MWVLNPKVEGEKQEEITERQKSFRQIGACGSRRSTVVGGGSDLKNQLYASSKSMAEIRKISRNAMIEENPWWCRSL